MHIGEARTGVGRQKEYSEHGGLDVTSWRVSGREKCLHMRYLCVVVLCYGDAEVSKCNKILLIDIS